MTDDKLHSLKDIRTPEPSAEARNAALELAMVAFDAEAAKESAPAPKGRTFAERLRSIVDPKRGTWTMNTRLTYGLGTAAIALLILPLGYQLLNSTALTQPGIVLTRERVETPPVEPVKPGVNAGDQDAATPLATTDGLANRKVSTVTVQPDGTILPSDAPKPEVDAAPQPLTEQSSADLAAPVPQTRTVAEPAPMMDATVETEAQDNLGGLLAAPPPAPQELAAGAAAMESFVQPAIAPNAITMSQETLIAPQVPPPGDEFSNFAESPVKTVAEAPVSTFSIDVDTASYSYVRSSLNEGFVPSPDAVRLEEFINYFPYDYPTPDSADVPFEPTVAVYPSPWSAGKQLVHIGIKGYEPTVAEDKPSNLTFLIDTSGSMDEPAKLPLLKRAFTLLVNQLSANDTVSIVVYAGSAGVVL